MSLNPSLRRILTLAFVIALLFASAPLSVASAGKPGGSTSWKYTALGDSLGTGIFASRGYVPRYKDYVQTDTGNSVSLTNLSQNGWTSTDLLNALKTDRKFRSAVKAAKVITWDIGGNDFLNARDQYRAGTCGGTDDQDCLRTAVARFETNWDAIIAEIFALRTGGSIVRTMDVYNPYVDEDNASDSSPDDGGLNDFQVFKPYVDRVNSHIATTSGSKNIPYARVYEAFNGADGNTDPATKGYLTFDGLHPNDTGHRVIADLFRGLGYASTP